MTRKKILWLCSWYPGKTDPFNGDFIQRHARAAALFNDIYVIHVTGDSTGRITKTEEETITSPGLTEQIIYFRRSSSAWGKLIAHYRWMSLFRTAIKSYVSKNGKPDLVHVQIPFKAGMFGLWMKRKYGIPYAVTEHWGIYNDIEVLNYSSRSNTFKRITRSIISKAGTFISVSRYLAEGVNRLVVKKNFEVVPNVANTDLFFYKEKSTAIFRFIHVSNMVPLKNVEGIVRGFSLFLHRGNKAELVMVGGTDPAIRNYAAGLEIPSGTVTFRGEVPYEQVAKEMQVADCLVLFSHIENSPCVIGEALCCGLPVIATNVGGIPELVDSSNAILIEPKQEVALAKAMEEIVNNHAFYDHKKIADHAKSKFSYSVVGEKLDTIYMATLHQ